MLALASGVGMYFSQCALAADRCRIDVQDHVLAAGPSSVAMLHVYCSLSNPSKARQARGQVVCDLEAVHIVQGPAAGQAWDSHLEAACQLRQSAASSSSLHVALLPLAAVFTEMDGRLEPCQATVGSKCLSPTLLRQHGRLVSLLQVGRHQVNPS